MRTLILAIVIAVLTMSSAVHAQERPGAVALTQAKLYGYATPAVVMTAGEEVTFTNLDIEMHDFVQDVEADGFGAKKRMPWCKKAKDSHSHSHGTGCPLFWTPLISLGETTAIQGTPNLKPGSYSFICTIHHGMTGTLTVL